jgi:hypothetical protein
MSAGYANFMDGFFKGRALEDDNRRALGEEKYRDELRDQQRTKYAQEQEDYAADRPVVAAKRISDLKRSQADTIDSDYTINNAEDINADKTTVRKAGVTTAVSGATVAKANADDMPNVIEQRKFDRQASRNDEARRSQSHQISMARQQLGLKADQAAAEGNQIALTRAKRQMATMDILGAFDQDRTPEGLNRAVQMFNQSNDVYAGQDMEARMMPSGRVEYGPKGGQKVIASVDEFTKHFAAGLDPAAALVSKFKQGAKLSEEKQEAVYDFFDEKFKANAGVDLTPDLMESWTEEAQLFISGKGKAGMSGGGQAPAPVLNFGGVRYVGGADGFLYDGKGGRYKIKDGNPVRVK